MSNSEIAKIIELREYFEFSVFQIAKRMAIGIDKVEAAIGRYYERPKETALFQSKANFDDRRWFIFTNRDKLSNKEMAAHLGLSEPYLRRLADEMPRKTYVRTVERPSINRETNITLNMQTGIYYKSVCEAALSLTHYSQRHIHAMVMGRKKTNYTDLLVV